MIIQILGIGCPACRQMESDVREIVARHRLNAVVERMDDPQQIAQFGLFAVPGLVIDNRVEMCGYKGKTKIERLILGHTPF